MLKRIKSLALGLAILCTGCTATALAVNVSTPAKVGFRVDVETIKEGKKYNGTGDYTFVLEAENDEPLPRNTTVTVHTSGEVYFGEAEFTSPGDYYYKVYQKAGPEVEGLVYDSNIYHMLVQIFSDDKGVLSSVVTNSKAGSSKKVEDIKFRNSFIPGGSQEEETKLEDQVVEPSNPSGVTPTSTSGTPTPKNGYKEVKTGDDTPILKYLVLMGAAAMALVVVLVVKFREKKRQATPQ